MGKNGIACRQERSRRTAFLLNGMTGRPVNWSVILRQTVILGDSEEGLSTFWPRAQESVQASAIQNVSKPNTIACQRIAFLANGMTGLPAKKRAAKLRASVMGAQSEPGLSTFRPRAQQESVQEDFRKNGVACRKERSRRIAFWVNGMTGRPVTLIRVATVTMGSVAGAKSDTGLSPFWPQAKESVQAHPIQNVRKNGIASLSGESESCHGSSKVPSGWCWRFCLCNDALGEG